MKQILRNTRYSILNGAISNLIWWAHLFSSRFIFGLKTLFSLWLSRSGSPNVSTGKSCRNFNCVRLRKNALLIQIGVEIVWDNFYCRECMDLGLRPSWDAYLASPPDFAGCPTWQRRESLGSRSSNALPDL